MYGVGSVKKQKDLLPSGMMHGWERFHLAVEQLATAPGDVRSRLEKAYFHLYLLLPQELPTQVRRDFKWIIWRLTKQPPRWEGDTELKASLARMRNRTGVEIAKRILKVYRYLDSEREERSRLI